jgi:hypothetical protein
VEWLGVDSEDRVSGDGYCGYVSMSQIMNKDTIWRIGKEKTLVGLAFFNGLRSLGRLSQLFHLV